jgi:hypothetical protein
LACETDEHSSLSTGGSKSIFIWDGTITTVYHTSPSGVPFLQAYVGNPPYQAFYNICNLAHNCVASTALSATTTSCATLPPHNEEQINEVQGQVSTSADTQSLADIDFNEDLDKNIQHIRSLMHAPIQSDK